MLDLKHIRKLEGLLYSIKLARQTKRKSFVLHSDELPAIEEAIRAALDKLEG
jgi:hypothetical protein